jgi:hypothetical protein
MVRVRVAIVVVEIVLDRRFEIIDTVKYAAPNTFLGNVPEETLNQVDPRGRGRREV